MLRARNNVLNAGLEFFSAPAQVSLAKSTCCQDFQNSFHFSYVCLETSCQERQEKRLSDSRLPFLQILALLLCVLSQRPPRPVRQCQAQISLQVSTTFNQHHITSALRLVLPLCVQELIVLLCLLPGLQRSLSRLQFKQITVLLFIHRRHCFNFQAFVGFILSHSLRFVATQRQMIRPRNKKRKLVMCSSCSLMS